MVLCGLVAQFQEMNATDAEIAELLKRAGFFE